MDSEGETSDKGVGVGGRMGEQERGMESKREMERERGKKGRKKGRERG